MSFYLSSLRKSLRKNWDLYLLIFPVVLYFIIFHYLPMMGIQLAFKNLMPLKGVWGSPWVGFEHFTRFFNSYYFWDLLKNTLGISIYSLAVGFPVPILLALMINEVSGKRFKKMVQTVTYAPHFISMVVMVGMITMFLSPQTGFINGIIEFLVESLFTSWVSLESSKRYTFSRTYGKTWDGHPLFISQYWRMLIRSSMNRRSSMEQIGCSGYGISTFHPYCQPSSFFLYLM